MKDNDTPRIVRGQRVGHQQLAFARAQRKEMSPVERVLWNRLRGNQVEGVHFRRQQVVGAYFADFYCNAAELAVEIDGATHEDDRRDRQRDAFFEAQGILVLRFSNQQITRELEAVLEVIRTVVLERTGRTAP